MRSFVRSLRQRSILRNSNGNVMLPLNKKASEQDAFFCNHVSPLECEHAFNTRSSIQDEFVRYNNATVVIPGFQDV